MSTYDDTRCMSSYVDMHRVSSYADTMSGQSIVLARSLPKLGEAVRRLRSDRGLTQAQLAEAAGVSRQWVVAVESGSKHGLEVGLIMHLLDTLDASLMVRDDRPDDAS